MSETNEAGARSSRRKTEIEYLQVLSTRPPRERRTGLLTLLFHRGGRIMPRWAVETDGGILYWPELSLEIQTVLLTDLEYLAANDYLERQHFDRIHRCGECSSHLLNIREICVECGSSNLEHLPVLHHFRCGYVAPIGEFESRGRGRDCPKCGHTMRNLGTDHEVVGELVRCRNCAITFDEPLVEAVCFRCGSRTPVDQLIEADIWGYRLTPLGQSAARAGRLFVEDDERLIEPDTQIFRRSIFLRLLRDDLRISLRYRIPCSLIALRLTFRDKKETAAAERKVVEVLNATLRNVDHVGRFGDGAMVIKLPATDTPGAEIVRSRLAERLNALDEIANATPVLVPLREEGTLETDIENALKLES